VEVLNRQLANEATNLGNPGIAGPRGPGRPAVVPGLRPLDDEPPARARTMLADRRTGPEDMVPLIQETQKLLAEQQLQLATALNSVVQQAEQQRIIAAEQARMSEQLISLRKQLAKERKLQRAAAHYIASHGKHSSE
jgi:hypothetical protein